jgi:hypothetical protein
MKKLLLITVISLFSITTKAQNWDEVIKTVASDRGADDYFGYSVSISGDKAIVGAYREEEDPTGNNTITLSGSAYIFELIGGTWTQTEKLVASDRGAIDHFGYSVSISGDKAIVGAYGEDEDASGINTESDAGSAYIFELIGGTWTQTEKIVASDRGTNDQFGYSVSISGDKAIIGAYREDEDAAGINTASEAGAAYIFELSGGSWTQTEKIVASDRAADDYFGSSVSISGDKAIVGAYGEDEDAAGINTASYAGSAYIFELSGGSWTQTEKIVASDRAADDYFGYSVSISGDRAIVGAFREDQNAALISSKSSAGSAYIFELSGGTWTQSEKIVASDRAADDLFGHSVSISDNKVIIGAYREDQDTTGANYASEAGSAYIFKTELFVGIEENSFGNNLIVYPNPTIGDFYIEGGENNQTVTITMTDINGKLIQCRAYNESQLLNLRLEEPAGVYFLMIESGAKKAVIRLVKE